MGNHRLSSIKAERTRQEPKNASEEIGLHQCVIRKTAEKNVGKNKPDKSSQAKQANVG
jgi:hypothetical protein